MYAAKLSICEGHGCFQRPALGSLYCRKHQYSAPRPAFVPRLSENPEPFFIIHPLISLVRPEPADRMTIYAIAVSGAVKFGSTQSLQKRLEYLQISNHRRMRILGHIRAKSELENSIHYHLKPHRIRGEWFRLCDASRKVIRCMREDDLNKLCELITL